MSKIQEKDRNVLVKWIDQFIDNFLNTKPPEIVAYVEKLREQNPGISQVQLARKIRNRKSMKNGLVGAATGIGGLITLPVTVPADLIATWKIQIALAFTVAYIFGHTKESTDLKTDIYLILAGSSAQEALKKVGVETIKGVTKKAVEKHITREVMKKIWKIIPSKIITKAGEKSLTSFMKMVPIAGAPVGFVFDYFGTRIVGNFAIKYYSGK
jgi:hypothetical protein